MTEREEKWTLRLSFEGPYGERYQYAQQFDVFLGREMASIPMPVPGLHEIDAVVSAIKQREIRKDVFKTTAMNMGLALAEHMENLEGWHGDERSGKEADARRWPLSKGRLDHYIDAALSQARGETGEETPSLIQGETE